MICISENQAQVGWHFAKGTLVSTSSTTNHFRQRRTATSATPSVSRLTTNRPDEVLTSAAANGLWTCIVRWLRDKIKTKRTKASKFLW